MSYENICPENELEVYSMKNLYLGVGAGTCA